ncbi:MAG: hypothetical protein LDLANPLL_02581 [Turneriella sp.]|nr:hypothetical protein [Turneriella sp.]
MNLYRRILVVLAVLFAALAACKTPPKIEHTSQDKTLDYLKRCKVLKSKAYSTVGETPDAAELAAMKKDGGSETYQVLFHFKNSSGYVSENYLFMRFWDCTAPNVQPAPTAEAPRAK